MIDKFEEALLKALNHKYFTTKATKDSDLEYVVLRDGERIEIGNKTVWSGKKRAENAIDRVRRGQLWWMSTDHVWRSIAGHNVKAPSDIHQRASKIREEWVDKHLRAIPLKAYMVMQDKIGKKK